MPNKSEDTQIALILQEQGHIADDIKDIKEAIKTGLVSQTEFNTYKRLTWLLLTAVLGTAVSFILAKGK